MQNQKQQIPYNAQHWIYFDISIFRSQDDEQQTTPPLKANFSDTANQWIIHDAYVNYESQRELWEEEVKTATSISVEKNRGFKRLVKTMVKRYKWSNDKNTIDEKDQADERLLRSAKILERMVNQESYKDIAIG